MKLFFPPDDFFAAGLRALPDALDAIMPQKRAHARDLPRALRDLSAQLTTERHKLSRPYWTSPRFTSAYLRYFLPWNLIRLGALLPGLPLDLPAGKKNKNAPLALDLGSGPLTFPLALWLSRPDLRALPLRVIASDLSPHILDLGQALFFALKEKLAPDCAWSIRTLRAPLPEAAKKVGEMGESADLVTLGNVLNEWDQAGAGREQDTPRLQSLTAQLERSLAPAGLLLALEPGTRLGGKLTARLRGCAQPRFQPLSPCPHNRACPMLAPGVRAWCHFNAPATAAPNYLRDLSRQAGLDKESVSLSFLLLRKTSPVSPEDRNEPGMSARLISEPFVLPGFSGRARYACTSQGLALIPDSAFLPPGCLIKVSPASGKDAKSGAKIMTLSP